MFGNKIEKRRARILAGGRYGDASLAASLVTVLSMQNSQPRGQAWAVVSQQSFKLTETGRRAHVTSQSKHQALVRIVLQGAEVGLVHELRADTASMTPMRFPDGEEAKTWVDALLAAYAEAVGTAFPPEKLTVQGQ